MRSVRGWDRGRRDSGKGFRLTESRRCLGKGFAVGGKTGNVHAALAGARQDGDGTGCRNAGGRGLRQGGLFIPLQFVGQGDRSGLILAYRAIGVNG